MPLKKLANPFIRAGQKVSPEMVSGLMLITAAALALIVSNTGASGVYFGVLEQYVRLGFGAFALEKSVLHWINDGLMAIFFLLVGLEIKREFLEGALSTPKKAALPLIAAVGGMAGPILVFLAVNGSSTETLNGWAIPAATDIAFALGVLALLGKRAPTSLKVLLLSIAVIDDVGAVAIIALFYTENVQIMMLGAAALCIGSMVALNVAGVRRLLPYLLLAALLWVFVLKSGVHATLAGVATAAVIPLRGRKEGDQSPLKRLEHALHPWSIFLILPIFAFANSGVSLGGIALADMATPLTLGVAAGLFFGKQLGVFLAVFGAAALKTCRKPEGVSWAQIYGLACLTGIGFTMSLFIGGLAFAEAAYIDQAKIGVLAGSAASAILGVAVLLRFAPKREADTPARRSDAGLQVPAE